MSSNLTASALDKKYRMYAYAYSSDVLLRVQIYKQSARRLLYRTRSINENPELEGKNRGKPIATIYIDDRALNYHGQTAGTLLAEIKKFKVYWKDEKNSKLREYWEQ